MTERPFKLLRSDGELAIIEQHLGALGVPVEVVSCASGDQEALAREAVSADCILTCYDRIPAELIAAAPRLRGVVKYGVGVDAIAIEAATRHGVLVVNCPDYGSETVADHAFALLLALARRIPTLAAEMRRRSWLWPAPALLGTDLAGKTLALLGIGRIGRAMARRALGFGMRVRACDPYLERAALAGLAVELCALDALLDGADFLSIHCVLTAETRGLIGAAELDRLAPGAYLVNVSRGAIVDQDALIAALRTGTLAGAGLDVYPEEPLTPGHPLLGLDNVVLTPHLAWYTREAFARVEAETRDNVRDLLLGRVPARVCNPGAIPRWRERFASGEPGA